MKELSEKGVIFIKPLFYERIWGGDYFAKKYNLDELKGMGEEWVLSAIPNKETVIRDTDILLTNFMKENSFLFNGENEIKLLYKVINAKTPLSVQVHPDDKQASLSNSLGKSEAWYIKDCQEDSYIYYGVKPTIKNTVVELIEKQKWEDLLKPLKVNKGDFIYIESGTVHALNQDITIIEIQQSSDITYRLYDYDRVDSKGQKRELHVEDSIKAIKFNKEYVIPFTDKYYSILCDNEYFKIERISSNGITRYEYLKFKVVIVENGEGFVNDIPFKTFDTFILLTNQKQAIFNGNFDLLIIEQK